MTSLAFIFGVVPLAIATGASSLSQRAIGSGVMGGMISGTILAVLFVPVFFVWVMRLARPDVLELHAPPAGPATKEGTVAAVEASCSCPSPTTTGDPVRV